MSGPRRAVLRDLAGNSRFVRLLGHQALSQLSDGLYQIAVAAVVVFNVSAARTPAQVSKVLAVTLLPFSLIGPFTGPFIDRFSRRSILVGASAVRTVLTVVLVLAVDGPELLVLGLAVANISVNRFLHAAKSAVLPTLVRAEQYLPANAVSSTTGMVVSLAGAVIGGPIADSFGPEYAISAAAVAMAAAGAVAATLPLPRGEKRGLAGILSELRENLRDVRDGLLVLRRSPPAVYGIASVWTMRGLMGFVLLAALVVLRSRFDVGATGFSVILGAVGVGSFIGAVTVPFVARRVGYQGVAPLAFVLAGAAAFIGGPIPAWPALLATVLVAGVAMASTKIAADTLVQRGVPDRYRGRAFAVYDIGYNGVFVAAALIPTLLRPFLGDVGVVLLTGALYLAGAAGLGAWRRRLPRAIEVHAYSGGRADETPRSVVINRRTVDVSDVEQSWQEERSGRQLLCFRIRLADGRRIQISRSDEGWSLDRELPSSAP
ncbi:MAG TPA: MFS transporter [Actinomycetota bacterium]|nr:MFS transporter [Actinomycetota bacterium]